MRWIVCVAVHTIIVVILTAPGVAAAQSTPATPRDGGAIRMPAAYVAPGSGPTALPVVPVRSEFNDPAPIARPPRPPPARPTPTGPRPPIWGTGIGIVLPTHLAALIVAPIVTPTFEALIPSIPVVGSIVLGAMLIPRRLIGDVVTDENVTAGAFMVASGIAQGIGAALLIAGFARRAAAAERVRAATTWTLVPSAIGRDGGGLAFALAHP
jgi:hypothetical protein